ncbi:hypothetical protein [Burkholderia cenocepacia]|uniref:hypothetical protein n=1 Tax=Burkholderia cenocepacia TaxID=95486 RepID=UPI00076CBF8D|nr:hypothetical protein [Burkholderia cenocepacia]KWU17029.1 hypothetical protein AS149_40180 [Burkholderia cenocepacia]
MSIATYDASPFFGRLFNTPLGAAMWNFLLREDVRIRMQTASDVEVPAVLALEKPLLLTRLLPPRAEVPPRDKLAYDMNLRMMGNMVRQIMSFYGYEYVCDGVPVNGRVFQYGSLYREAIAAIVDD